MRNLLKACGLFFFLISCSAEDLGLDTYSPDYISDSGDCSLYAGALAFSANQGGGWSAGLALDYNSKDDAERVAFASCKAEGGTDCEVQIHLTADNEDPLTCFVLAVGDGQAGFGKGNTIYQAENSALGYCNGASCEVELSGCVTPLCEISPYDMVGNALGASGGSSVQPQQPQQPQQDYYIAIAVSQQDGELAYGRSGGRHTSKAEAETAALNLCRSAGGIYCEVAGSVQNGCIALAKTDVGNGAGVSARSTQQGAEAAAVQSCQSANPGSCSVVTSACT